MAWRKVLDGVYLFADSCNVWAVEGPSGMVLIDAGTGAWLESLGELSKRPAALLLTHFFRDHAAGAVEAAKAGIPVYAPEAERDILADPLAHLSRRETYIIYDNYWDLFVPIEPIALAGVLRDYDRVHFGGLALEVVPLPGATMTQVGLLLRDGNGRKLVFCGEAIHSPGRLARVAPLQYNYNDLPGASWCYYSAQQLRRIGPTALLPSLGRPIVEDCDEGLAQLQGNLRRLCAHRPGMIQEMDAIDAPSLERISEHVYRSRDAVAISTFLVSRSGKVLAIDYGYGLPRAWPAYPHRYTRRPLLHSLDALAAQVGTDRIDTVLLTHFHDDHCCGVPILRRLHGTRCWASEQFADLVESPHAHRFPCNWPQPVPVDRRLPRRGRVSWEEFTFELCPMNGHTRFSTLIAFEADGKRFAHTGDQYIYDPGNPEAFENLLRPNHVFQNGAMLDGFSESVAALIQLRPDVILGGHWPVQYPDARFFQTIEAYAAHFRQTHAAIMPLEPDEPHFELDSWGGWLWPYRTHMQRPGTLRLTATARNPFPHPATLELRLVGPDDSAGPVVRVEAPPRGEVAQALEWTAKQPRPFQAVALELTANERCFGQVAEAMVTMEVG